MASSSYRYGFNGKENDNEIKGEGNQQDYGMRISDPRLGRFLSVDPISKQYPELTPYQFASNRPIDGTDLDGLEWNSGNDQKGRIRNSNDYEREFYPVRAFFRDLSAHLLNQLTPAGALDDALDTWMDPEASRADKAVATVELLTAPNFYGRPKGNVQGTPNVPSKTSNTKPVITNPTKRTATSTTNKNATTIHNGNPNAVTANNSGNSISGTGEYKKVGGHHVHAKAGFKGHINYDPEKGFSISQDFMKTNGLDHDVMTATQRKLFKDLKESNKPNTLAEHTRIAREALIAGGATESVANQLIIESLNNLKQQGVNKPTRIPWQKK